MRSRGPALRFCNRCIKESRPAVSVTSSHDNGLISITPMRPARLSETERSMAGELEPATTNRPRSPRCSSIATRRAGKRSGRTWASSIATFLGFRRKKVSGSRATTCKSARRSRSKRSCSCAFLVFFDGGPCEQTTVMRGSLHIRSSLESISCRFPGPLSKWHHT